MPLLLLKIYLKTKYKDKYPIHLDISHLMNKDIKNQEKHLYSSF